MKKITFGLIFLGILLSFESNGETTEFVSYSNLYYDNQASVEAFEKKLNGFNKALRNSRTRFNAILNKGSKIFDDKKNQKLFNPNKKIYPHLKKLFKRIYDARYPEALNAWLEIKYMASTDPNQREKLNNFKEKIRLLLRDVQEAKTYAKSLNKSSQQGYTTYNQ